MDIEIVTWTVTVR